MCDSSLQCIISCGFNILAGMFDMHLCTYSKLRVDPTRKRPLHRMRACLAAKQRRTRHSRITIISLDHPSCRDNMTTETATKKEGKTVAPTVEIKANIALIERAVAELEPRFTHRVLRSLTALRKRIDNKVLQDAIKENYPAGACFILLFFL